MFASYNLARISVVAPPETVIKKLSRANIPLSGLQKKGAVTTFAVGDNYIKKVFAIFAHPCYNICVIKYGGLRSLAVRVLSRAGAIAGAAAFICAIVISQSFVFKIDVVGSGSYLASEVRAILREGGVRVGGIYSAVGEPAPVSRIMALPQVTFCSISKRGTAVIVDVECDAESSSGVSRAPLLSPVAGEVQGIVAICGTPRVTVGQQVEAGDELISPQYISSDGSVEACICVGYAHIKVSAEICVAAEEESEQALRSALAAVNLYSDSAAVTSYSAKAASGGVIYTVNFTYTYTASVNMQ